MTIRGQSQSFGHKLEAYLTSIWYKGTNPGINSTWLTPLSIVYAGLRKLSKQEKKSIAAKAQHQSPPVLVIGNLIAGGAGKTPVVKAVCDAMRAKGKRVGIISRGYKRQNQKSGPVYIPAGAKIDAKLAGDEPAWLASQTGCAMCVDTDRLAAYNLLTHEDKHLDLIVSDDGLQHHRLPRKIEWVVFDDRAAGNGLLLPAGPLREPLSRLSSVDAVISGLLSVENLGKRLGVVPSDCWFQVQASLLGFSHPQSGNYVSCDDMLKMLKAGTSIAFTGLGHPEKFFKMLSACQLETGQNIGLPDHFDYPHDYLNSLTADILLTTGKDAVKLPTNNAKLWVADFSVTLPNELLEQIDRVC